MKKIYFITGNKFKFDEAKHILPALVQVDIDLTEIQETDTKKIISHKLDEALKHGNGPYVVDDVSLEIACLNGFPGPLIKWMIKQMSIEKIAELVSRYENHTAVATIMVGYAERRKRKVIKKFFTGSWHGSIVPPRGDLAFGWSPMFLPNGSTRTAGEMTAKEHSIISMRAEAFNKLKKYLQNSAKLV